jgi:hypothetical protein
MLSTFRSAAIVIGRSSAVLLIAAAFLFAKPPPLSPSQCGPETGRRLANIFDAKSPLAAVNSPREDDAPAPQPRATRSRRARKHDLQSPQFAEFATLALSPLAWQRIF